MVMVPDHHYLYYNSSETPKGICCARYCAEPGWRAGRAKHSAARVRERQAGENNTAHRTEVTTQSTQQVYDICFLLYSELQQKTFYKGERY